MKQCTKCGRDLDASGDGIQGLCVKCQTIPVFTVKLNDNKPMLKSTIIEEKLKIITPEKVAEYRVNKNISLIESVKAIRREALMSAIDDSTNIEDLKEVLKFLVEELT